MSDTGLQELHRINNEIQQKRDEYDRIMADLRVLYIDRDNIMKDEEQYFRDKEKSKSALFG